MFRARTRSPAARCVGCGETAAPRSKETASDGIHDGGIDAGEPGGGEPPRRLRGGTCSESCTGLCAARRRQRRRGCPHLCGHDCAARCGCVPQERSHERRDRCTGCRASRWTATLTPAAHEGLPCRGGGRPAAGQGKRSAQRPKGAEARGIAAVSTRSGDRSGEPGREATRPNPSQHPAQCLPSSAPGPGPAIRPTGLSAPSANAQAGAGSSCGAGATYQRSANDGGARRAARARATSRRHGSAHARMGGLRRSAGTSAASRTSGNTGLRRAPGRGVMQPALRTPRPGARRYAWFPGAHLTRSLNAGGKLAPGACGGRRLPVDGAE